MLKSCFACGVVFATLLLAASPAQAVVVRAWVSGKGNDVAGCGAPTNACRTLQYTHDNIIADGGEIDILDPAGYGAITITKSLSIVNDGVGTAGLQTTSGNAITINASGAAVYLRGLSLDGVQKAGTNGIEAKAVGSLIVVNCVARHFQNDGLLVDPSIGSVQLGIYDSLFVENGTIGVALVTSGSASMGAVMNHVTADKNENGIVTDGQAAIEPVRLTISNSEASNNESSGIIISSRTASVSVEVNNSSMDSNGGDGLVVHGSGAAGHVARSVLDYNDMYAMVNDTTAPGTLSSSGDNHVEGNGSGTTSGTITTDALR
jgi:hypothetical protein